MQCSGGANIGGKHTEESPEADKTVPLEPEHETTTQPGPGQQLKNEAEHMLEDQRAVDEKMV